ncbi:MAG TPA: hypothetical protein VMH48_04960 [Methylomirabilota bacterium]|nr:hypothetical protein [Methylomirabilota bacterium]
MEPRKFTPEELTSLLQQAVSWLHQQRDYFLPSSIPLDQEQKSQLAPFFPIEILDRARILDASQSGETIPYPPFYETVRAGGARVVPDAAHVTGIPFVDVIVFNRAPTLRTIFHNLVHVTQFAMLGEERVMRGYLETLNESGLWMVVPYEEQAYQMDARFTLDPADVFSVEAEIRDWARQGRF